MGGTNRGLTLDSWEAGSGGERSVSSGSAARKTTAEQSRARATEKPINPPHRVTGNGRPAGATRGSGIHIHRSLEEAKTRFGKTRREEEKSWVKLLHTHARTHARTVRTNSPNVPPRSRILGLSDVWDERGTFWGFDLGTAGLGLLLVGTVPQGQEVEQHLTAQNHPAAIPTRIIASALAWRLVSGGVLRL
ncbi:hypothetical protein NHX12_010126 [Muraenolepis orangiensis]|uniref:Uncharacterized protein n=1 Tax=Muraenolepis orangiensis TaxID=630683 RepID=A0A9Q0DJ49_9TELE|nr:hypothetical protein NHX12_010126 [Muraenolepis orangiensis]